MGRETTEGGSPPPSLLQMLVLAAIIKRPSYGYEISARLNRICEAFLKVHPTSIYSTIDRLAHQQLILESDREPSSKRAVRVTYRATKAGAKAYSRWIASELERPDHVELMARLAMAGPAGPAGIRVILKRYEQACARAIDELDVLESQAGDPVQSIEWFTGDLVIAAQRESLEGTRRWITQACRRTDKFELAQ